MKVGFDIDGTLTEFDKFVKQEGEKYMLNKYGFSIQNHCGYDVDGVFELKEKLKKEGYTLKEAEEQVKKIVNDFWNKNYLKYILNYKLQDGASDFIKKIKEEGHEVCLFTSRTKTADPSIIGKLVRSTVKLQLLLGEIDYNEVNFYETDEEKISGLLNSNVDIHFDDKKCLLEKIENYIDVVCVDNPYNKDFKGDRITDYKKEGYSLLLKKRIIKR